MNSTNETQLLDSIKIGFGSKMMGFVTPVITLIGLVFNPMIFYIYSRPIFAKIPAVVYLKALSVMDTLTIIQSLTFSLPTFGFDPKQISTASCKILWYFVYFVCASSSWIEAFIAFDRCLSVAFFNRFKILAKKPFQCFTIILLVTFNALLYLPIVVFYELDSNSTECKSFSDLYYEDLSWIDLMNSTVVPFFVMLVSSIITISCLIRSRKRSSTSSSNAVHHHRSTTVTQSTALRHSAEASNQSNKSASRNNKPIKIKSREEKEFQFAFISITLNALFFLFNISLVVYNLLASYVSIDPSDSILLFYITYTIFCCNFSYKFFVYAIINSKFRQELKSLIPFAFNTVDRKHSTGV